jgi:hypothetical protein
VDYRFLTIGATLAVTLSMVAGCQEGFTTGPGNGRCSIRPDLVHASRGKQGEMGGKATMKCDVAVTDALLEVRLEQKRGSSWALIADNTKLAGKFSPFIGALAAGQGDTRQAFVACAAGTYRIAARGSAALDGVPSKSSAWEYGPTSTDPCAKGSQ